MKKELSTREMAKIAILREPWIVFEEAINAYAERKKNDLPEMSFWIKEFELWSNILFDKMAEIGIAHLKTEMKKIQAMSDAERLEYLSSKIQW